VHAAAPRKETPVHVTIRTYSSPGLVDALLDNESEVRRVITEIDGFRAYYLARTGGGAAVTISVFDDERSGEESTRRAVEWLRENLADLFDSPPQVTRGEVVFSF
jgi:quinol monooxygenase YgiN